jgi:hypothetical protein
MGHYRNGQMAGQPSRAQAAVPQLQPKFRSALASKVAAYVQTLPYTVSYTLHNVSPIRCGAPHHAHQLR